MYLSKDRYDCDKRGQNVAILITYIGMNIVLSAFLERASKRTAYIFHAVLFFFTFSLLLIVTDNGVTRQTVVELIGEDTFNAVTTVVLGTRLSVMLPLLVVEVALVLQTLLVALFTVQRIVTYLGGSKRKAYERLSATRPTPPRWQSDGVIDQQRLYALLQVMLC